MEKNKPVIGVLLGDPTGIGPELVAKLAADEGVYDQANIVIIGDYRIFQAGQSIAKTDTEVPVVKKYEDIRFPLERPVLLDFPTLDPAEVEMGRSMPRRASLCWILYYTASTWRKKGSLTVIFAPFNKQAMHLCGCPYKQSWTSFRPVQ